jgi:uncharacterized protein involved in exopolysaccharide biosynthesis
MTNSGENSRGSAPGQMWQGHIYPLPDAPTDRSAAFAAADVFRWLRRIWVWLCVGAIAGAMLGAGAAFLQTRQYRSTVVVVVAPATADPLAGSLLSGRLGGLAGLAGLSLGQSDGVQESIAVLRSRELADRFIAERALHALFFRDQWDAVNKRWREQAGKPVPTQEDAYLYFDRNVRSVDEDRRTGLLRLSMQWSDREAASQWANEYVRAGNELLRERARRNALASLQFLEKELASVSQMEVRQAIYQLIEGQKKQEMLAAVREDYAFRVIDAAKPSDPDRPVKPKTPLIVAAGALGGLALALTLCWFLGAGNRMRPLDSPKQ